MDGLVRLQKHIARAGIASRRGAEQIIREGRVSVNGQVVREQGTRIDPARDDIRLDGKRLELAPPIWVALHKPRGFVSTRRDPQGRRTVYDLLPSEFRSLFTVGRLDADSEGLLLLTNEGDAANRLLHPRYQVERVYLADVQGHLTEQTLRRLRGGVELEDGVARPTAVRTHESRGEKSRIELVLAEGRKREVRRLMAAVGHPVIRLRRIRYGPISLSRLPSGKWRRLSNREIERVRNPQSLRPTEGIRGHSKGKGQR
jgi:23S rRNA pseudouridine2605 synthase